MKPKKALGLRRKPRRFDGVQLAQALLAREGAKTWQARRDQARVKRASR